MTGIDSFSSEIRLSPQYSYAEYWENEIGTISKHPILRTYFLKTVHSAELYLSLNMDTVYKKRIARFRVS